MAFRFGTPQADTLTGTDAADTVLGFAGNDSLLGAPGGDTIEAGSGDDTIHGGSAPSTVASADGDNTISAGDGNDRIRAGNGADIVHGGDGNDSIEGHGFGTGPSPGAEQGAIRADLADVLAGDSGNDTIFGAGGDDTLSGDAGDDTLRGGPGADRLAGGSGADRFVIGVEAPIPSLESAAGGGNRDVIADFQPGTDLLVFSGLGSGPAQLIQEGGSTIVRIDQGFGRVTEVELIGLPTLDPARDILFG